MAGSMAVKGNGFEIADFAQIEPAVCPCGLSRRVFVDNDGSPSLHLLEVTADEELPHRHPTDEIYYIRDCGPDAGIELNGQFYPLSAGMEVKIKGGTFHRPIRGSKPMTALVFVATGHGSPEATMEFPE